MVVENIVNLEKYNKVDCGITGYDKYVGVDEQKAIVYVEVESNKQYLLPDKNNWTIDYLNKLPNVLLDYLKYDVKAVFILLELHNSKLDTSVIEKSGDIEFYVTNNNKFRLWYQNINKRWKTINETPVWLKEDKALKDQWTELYQSKLNQLNALKAQAVENEAKAREALEKKVLEIQNNLETEVDNLVHNCEPLKIHALTFNDLPAADQKPVKDITGKKEIAAEKRRITDGYKQRLLKEFLESNKSSE